MCTFYQIIPMNYILFLAQEGNLETRSLLIPADKFLSNEKRKNDYEMLKSASTQFTLNIKNNMHDIDNLIIINKSPIFDNNSNIIGYRSDDYPFQKIYSDLMFYANRYDGRYISLDDKPWVEDTYSNFCSGFNHVKNYTRCKDIKEINGRTINVVDSLLILESLDGKLNVAGLNVSK